MDVWDLSLDCGDYCLNLFYSGTGILVLRTARTAAVFVVDLPHFCDVAVEVDASAWCR